MVMVDSASTSREVCLHIARKQGLSDHLGFSLQVAVYDKVLARVPSTARLLHTRRAAPALVSCQPRHHSPSQLPNTDASTNSRLQTCLLTRQPAPWPNTHTLSLVSHTHTPGRSPAVPTSCAKPLTLRSSESHASMWRSHQHCPILTPHRRPTQMP